MANVQLSTPRAVGQPILRKRRVFVIRLRCLKRLDPDGTHDVAFAIHQIQLIVPCCQICRFGKWQIARLKLEQIRA